MESVGVFLTPVPRQSPPCPRVHTSATMTHSSLLVLAALMAAAAAQEAAQAEAPLVQTAMEVLARATSSSSVLSFNLTGQSIQILRGKIGQCQARTCVFFLCSYTLNT